MNQNFTEVNREDKKKVNFTDNIQNQNKVNNQVKEEKQNPVNNLINPNKEFNFKLQNNNLNSNLNPATKNTFEENKLIKNNLILENNFKNLNTYLPNKKENNIVKFDVIGNLLKTNINQNKKSKNSNFLKQVKEQDYINFNNNNPTNLKEEKYYNDKILDLPDFIQGRISELSNNIENMDFENKKTNEEITIKRDFSSNQNFKGENNPGSKNINNRVTIDIAREVNLISNDDIDYIKDNEFDNRNNEFINTNPFMADLIKINNLNNNNANKNNKYFEINSNKENNQHNKFNITNENKFQEIKNPEKLKPKNTFLNRITQVGPLVNLDTKESSEDSSFCFDNTNINLNNIKINNLFNNKNNINAESNNNPYNDNNNYATKNVSIKNDLYVALNDVNKEKINFNFAVDIKKEKNELSKNVDVNLQNKNDLIFKDPFANIIKFNNYNKTNLDKNDNNLIENPFTKELEKKNLFIKTNKTFETLNKKDNNLNDQNDCNLANNNNKIKEIKNIYENLENFNKKINFGKKVTIGLNDIFNMNNNDDSSVVLSSKRQSEKNLNKFTKKRKKIKRTTLNLLNKKDIFEVPSDEEENTENDKNNEKEIDNKEIISEEQKINNLENDMDICDNENKNDFEENSVLNEADEILKNLEKNNFENFNNNNFIIDKNKKNINFINNNFNPFLSAVKEKKNNENKIIDNKLNTPLSICNNNDDYLLATPGKYFLSNNSSKVKEKPFSKFTGFIPDQLINNNKPRNIEVEMNNNFNEKNLNTKNFNPFDIQLNLNKNDRLKNLENNNTNRENFRATLNNKITFDEEEGSEVSRIESPCKKNLQIKNVDLNINMNKLNEDQKKVQIKENMDIQINNKLNINTNIINTNIIKNENINQTIQNNYNLTIKENKNLQENNNPIREEYKETMNANDNIYINNSAEENKGNANMSFSQFANENIIEINLNEELDQEDVDIKSLTSKIRDRTIKLFEYLKEIFRTRYSRMRTTEKALKEKQEHLDMLNKQIDLYKKEIETLEKEISSVDLKKYYLEKFDKFYKFFSRKILNTKILGIEFNTLNLIFSNAINLSFLFDNLNYKILSNNNIDKEIYENLQLENNKNDFTSERFIYEKISLSRSHKENLEKMKFLIKEINFTFIPQFKNELKFKEKIIEDIEINKIFKKMISFILNNIFTNKVKKFYSMTIFEFFEGYKIFIKATTNIVHFMKQFYLWDSIFNNVFLEFDEMKEILIMNFTINCTGYLLILTFTCDIFDAFFGYDFTGYNIIKINFVNDMNLERNKIDKICEQIKAFLEGKNKIFNPYFFSLFIQNVKKRIMDLKE